MTESTPAAPLGSSPFDGAEPYAPAPPPDPPRAGSWERRTPTDELLPQVYAELRRLADRHLARELPGQTLQPTALAHEAWMRLGGPLAAGWDSRAHFLGAAARAIRRILIERARARGSAKRGGGVHVVPLDLADADAIAREHGPRLDLLALDEALERLGRLDARRVRIVELRFFGGLSEEETAAALGLSTSTVTREWRLARIWLHRELGEGDPS